LVVWELQARRNLENWGQRDVGRGSNLAYLDYLLKGESARYVMKLMGAPMNGFKGGSIHLGIQKSREGIDTKTV